LQELITEINKDKSHITTKIRQTRSLLDSVSRKSMVIDSKEIDLQEYYQNVYNGKCPKNLTGIMNTLPPPFYTPHIVLTKKIDKKQIEIEKMSAGERQFIYMFSTYIYHLCNLLSIQDSKRIKYRNVNLVFDEVEICFHPEYQRTFINKLLSTLDRIGLTRNCAFNVIIATHSPFILSDIPQSNILYLEEGADVSDTIKVNPFGANINDILRQSFFLKNGFVGEFAKQKILSLVDYLSPDTDNNKNEWTKESSKYFIDNQIGDEIIKEQLSRLYHTKFDEA
jgi:predicted ATP-dependent endonuclease of OLD family